MYRNLGNGRFADVAARSCVAGPPLEWSSGCTWLDYDRDGHLDLFVTSYQQFDPASAPLPDWIMSYHRRPVGLASTSGLPANRSGKKPILSE